VRLFVALDLPADIRESVWRAAAPLRERAFPVRWAASENFHLTLKFLGAVPDPRRAELQDALHAAVQGARAVPVSVEAFGAFPAADRPRVIWAAVGAEPGLELLQHGVEQAFAPLGFPPEGRPFRPHLTLGRVGRGVEAREFAGLGDALESLSVQAATVADAVVLMQSTLHRDGAVYQELDRERLP
jgi:2'-5' RNA ligase